MRKTAKVGINLIESFEKCELVAYKAVPTEKYWTIGWGHYGVDVHEGMTITQEQADQLFVSDLAEREDFVNDSYYCPVTDDLNQNQFDALVSFCYNCGQGSLRGLCIGRTVEQIATHIPDYNRSGGIVLAGLVRRRQEEVDLYMKEDEEEMAKIAELQAQIQTLLNTAEAHVERINALEAKASMKVPDWAKEAVTAATSTIGKDGKPLIDTPDGASFDFYRVITILHRKGVI